MKLVIIGLTFIYFVCIKADNVFEEIGRNKDLSRFKEILDSLSAFELYNKEGMFTAFAPTNEALEEFQNNYPNVKFTRNFLSQHFVSNIIVTRDNFDSKGSISSMRNLRLWLSSVKSDPNSVDENEFYVNYAKLLNMDSAKKIQVGDDNDISQILYVIDRVLNPVGEADKNAMDLLRDPKTFGIDLPVESFASRVKKYKLNSLFETGSANTFFIPIGDLTEKMMEDVDSNVIRGHIIPNKVLFTRTMNSVYKSALYQRDGIKVDLSLVNLTNSPNPGFTLKVKSNTKIDIKDRNGPRKGVVHSKLLRSMSNIPVSNGVVHLITDPLMVINTDVLKILDGEQAGRFSQFMDFMEKAGTVRSEIESIPEKTVFVPTNDAFRMIPEEKINLMKNDPEAASQLVKLHIIPSSLSTDDVQSKHLKEFRSMDRNRNLYFSVVGGKGNKTLTVEGGGVNAMAIEADIGATDGIVHIINHVLGMPFRNMFEKMKTDAKLNISYKFGQNANWNEMFKNLKRNFTFFAPNNDAWNKLKLKFPTAFKQLNLGGEYSEHIKKIFDRHLILDKIIPSADLITNPKKTVKTKSATLDVAYFGDQGTVIELIWEKNQHAQIVRPDVQATNGVIHVVDLVFMERRDVSDDAGSLLASLFTTFFSILFLKFVI